MTRLTRAIDVEAPPSAIWERLADFGAIVEWAPNVEHSCLMSDQTDGIGTARRVQTAQVVLVERVVTWEPQLMLAYTIEGLPPMVGRVSNTWVVRARGGGSAVSLITDIDPTGGPVARVAGRVVGRRLTQASETMLGGMASSAEERP